MLISLTMVALLSFPTTGDCQDAEEATRIQIECERYRETHFNQGSVSLRIETFADDGIGGRRPTSETVLKSWFSGDCLRTDVLNNAPSFQCSICENKYIWATSEDSPVTIAPKSEYADPVSHFGLIHPRWIGTGCNPIGALSQGRQSRCLIIENKAYPDPPVLTHETIDGANVVKIAYSKEGVIPASLLTKLAQGKKTDSASDSVSIEPKPYRSEEIRWIAPEQGYALLKSLTRTTYPTDEIEILQELNANYAIDPVTKIWYPSHVTCTTLQNDRFLTGSQIDVQEISFSPPDPKTFEVESFGLSTDRRVNDRTQGPVQQDFFWDGSKLVPIPKAIQQLDSPPLPSRWSKWVLLGNAIFLAMIGIYFLIIRRRRCP